VGFFGPIVSLSVRCRGGEGACRQEGNNSDDLGVMHGVDCCFIVVLMEYLLEKLLE